MPRVRAEHRVADQADVVGAIVDVDARFTLIGNGQLITTLGPNGGSFVHDDLIVAGVGDRHLDPGFQRDR